MTAQTQHSKPIRLAHAALTAAIDGKWRKASDLVTRISTECPGPGIGDALIAWCDALAEHSNGGPVEFGKVRVRTLETETGAIDADAGRTPYLDWAGRLVVARGAGDFDAFAALLDEVNAIPDGFERGRYAGQLLESAALTIRNLPYGYARMGGTR